MPTITKSNWRVSYAWSASSGLRLGVCDYQGLRVLHAASVPFVYVNYAGHAAGPFTDMLRSRRRRVELREIMFGFDLRVTYDWYGEDYQYNHLWRFHEDGQFGSAVIIQGPGEEIDGRHVYHLPFRFDLDVSGAGGDSFQKATHGRWADVAKEGRHKSTVAPAYEWRLIDKVSGRSAQVRARSGDDGELWALQYKQREIWASWGAAGRGAPGSASSVPAIYDSNQSVQNQNVVLWYIAHVPSVDRVAVCGPWFKLEGYPPPEPHGHDDDDPPHDHGPHG